MATCKKANATSLLLFMIRDTFAAPQTVIAKKMLTFSKPIEDAQVKNKGVSINPDLTFTACNVHVTHNIIHRANGK